MFSGGIVNACRRSLNTLCDRRKLSHLERSAVLLLNGTNGWPPLWKKLWNKAVFRACTDGAGNSLESLVRFVCYFLVLEQWLFSVSAFQILLIFLLNEGIFMSSAFGFLKRIIFSIASKARESICF